MGTRDGRTQSARACLFFFSFTWMVLRVWRREEEERWAKNYRHPTKLWRSGRPAPSQRTAHLWLILAAACCHYIRARHSGPRTTSLPTTTRDRLSAVTDWQTEVVKLSIPVQFSRPVWITAPSCCINSLPLSVTELAGAGPRETRAPQGRSEFIYKIKSPNTKLVIWNLNLLTRKILS